MAAQRDPQSVCVNFFYSVREGKHPSEKRIESGKFYTKPNIMGVIIFSLIVLTLKTSTPSHPHTQ